MVLLWARRRGCVRPSWGPRCQTVHARRERYNKRSEAAGSVRVVVTRSLQDLECASRSTAPLACGILPRLLVRSRHSRRILVLQATVSTALHPHHLLATPVEPCRAMNPCECNVAARLSRGRQGSTQAKKTKPCSLVLHAAATGEPTLALCHRVIVGCTPDRSASHRRLANCLQTSMPHARCNHVPSRIQDYRCAGRLL
ncbi:hypothetical protein GY45DRAFT_1054393 [Cubamyces sp. BRFM 1775]|nr:hypothetical protein GY45DRAFT_1054393 [Cubamyces sp. BRFM 1775]